MTIMGHNGNNEDLINAIVPHYSQCGYTGPSQWLYLAWLYWALPMAIMGPPNGYNGPSQWL